MGMSRQFTDTYKLANKHKKYLSSLVIKGYDLMQNEIIFSHITLKKDLLMIVDQNLLSSYML